MNAVGSFSSNLPKSALIGYRISDSDDGTFVKKEVIIISSGVADVLSTLFIK
jgi:hypothetical protein